MTIGSVPNIYWAHRRQAYIGPMCTFQGAIQTIGETAVAFATILVTLYTFAVMYLNRRLPWALKYRPWVCLGVIGSTWLWVILWGVIPIGVHSGQEPDVDGARTYYTRTPWCECLIQFSFVSLISTTHTGCWINGRYMKYRIVSEYLWCVSPYFRLVLHKSQLDHRLWVAGVGTICLYIPSYTILRGNRQEQDAMRRAARGTRQADAQTLASSVSSTNKGDSPFKTLW